MHPFRWAWDKMMWMKWTFATVFRCSALISWCETLYCHFAFIRRYLWTMGLWCLSGLLANLKARQQERFSYFYFTPKCIMNSVEHEQTPEPPPPCPACRYARGRASGVFGVNSILTWFCQDLGRATQKLDCHRTHNSLIGHGTQAVHFEVVPPESPICS